MLTSWFAMVDFVRLDGACDGGEPHEVPQVRLLQGSGAADFQVPDALSRERKSLRSTLSMLEIQSEKCRTTRDRARSPGAAAGARLRVQAPRLGVHDK